MHVSWGLARLAAALAKPFPVPRRLSLRRVKAVSSSRAGTGWRALGRLERGRAVHARTHARHGAMGSVYQVTDGTGGRFAMKTLLTPPVEGRRRGAPRALPARDSGVRHHPASERRSRCRSRHRSADRRAVPRHATARGRGPLGGARPRRLPRTGRRRRARRPSLRGPRGRPRARHRPPRRETVEPLPRERADRRRREGDRLRPREGVRPLRRPQGPHRDRALHGNAAVRRRPSKR